MPYPDLPDDARDREILGEFRRWPLRPVMPLKNFAEGRYGQTGTLVEQRGVVVYRRPWWEVSAALRKSQLERLPHNTYRDMDEMLDDGWRCD